MACYTPCYEIRNYPKTLILVDKFNKERRIELEVVNEFSESYMITIWQQQGYEPQGYEHYYKETGNENIEMNNDTINNESLETSGIINSFDEWKSIINNKEHPNCKYDFDNAKILVEKCNINYFMKDPIVIFESKPILAYSRVYYSIEEIAEEFNKINNHSKVFLYMLFTRIATDDEFWVVRYGVL